MSNLVKRSFSLNGHRTSIALEAEFWAVLTVLAAADGMRVAALIARLDAARDPTCPLASVLRVHALHADHAVC
ncbi:MAG: aryl-sulfate sulfotransferase [Acetobacteraceae bacterium]|nr:aryl-sulfate sulfotransferase [Acetobacteraceae bacterium]MSP30049.1 aryl-sulfate sulfotransferase [Acetobacteraceae bacterium]